MLVAPGQSVTSLGYVSEIIDTAVGPVFLLAGIGAFLNVCAGRLSRIVDRARDIEPKLLASEGEEQRGLGDELRLLDRRMGIVTKGIFLTVLSAVLICAVVVLLFADPFIQTPLGAPIAIIFMGSIISLGFGFFAFLLETRLGARAVRIRSEVLQQISREGD